VPTLARRPPTPDANALELFAHIVAAGSFAAAARELRLTRAAVSRRVAHIESQLGQALFARSTRALGLTEAGRALAVRARAVREAAEAARRGLRARQAGGEGLAGTLRITSVPSFAQAVLARQLALFQQQHPALRIELTLTNRRVELLREDIDVAFRLTARPPADCVATPVLDFRVHAYAAPRPGVPLPHPEALTHNRCLVFSPPTDEAVLQWQHTSGATHRVTVQPAMLGDDLGTLQAAARAGAGVLFAPDFCVAADLARGELQDALPGWHLPVDEVRSVQALTLPLAQASESARALVRHVRDALRAAPAGGP
jgi:DNA-binding transcriptional LysR family regulator